LKLKIAALAEQVCTLWVLFLVYICSCSKQRPTYVNSGHMMFQFAFYVVLFQGCGKQHFWEITYEIASPDYPDDYGTDVRCFYYIHNPFNHLLTVTFYTFAIEHGSNCMFDYLKVGIPCD